MNAGHNLAVTRPEFGQLGVSLSGSTTSCKKWLFRIVPVQPLRYKHNDIPNRNRIDQDGERINLLSDGPEDGSGDCGNRDVNDLLSQDMYERRRGYPHADTLSEPRGSRPSKPCGW